MTDNQPGSGGDGTFRLPTPDMSVFGDETPDDTRADTPADTRADTPTEPTGEHGPAGRPHGRMTFQDAGTVPHEPTLAERRARQRAEEEAEVEQERQIEAELAAARRRSTRRKVLIGSVVVAGAVALIGSQYLFNSGSTTATCVGADPNDSNQAVGDQYCDESYVTSHGGYVNNGIIFLPIGNGGFRQYRYYYGGTVSGGRVSGGSYTPPSSGTLKTGSGKTISRGGFGVPSGSTGGSGSKGGSSGGKSGGS